MASIPLLVPHPVQPVLQDMPAYQDHRQPALMVNIPMELTVWTAQRALTARTQPRRAWCVVTGSTSPAPARPPVFSAPVVSHVWIKLPLLLIVLQGISVWLEKKPVLNVLMATIVLPKLDPVLNAQRDRNVLTGLTSSPLQIVLPDISVLLDKQLAHYVIKGTQVVPGPQPVLSAQLDLNV